jgi:lysophospholipase D
MKNTWILHPERTKFKMADKGSEYSHHLIAHRGGSSEAPENTLQAFKKAIELGCHMLELDVRITKDKKIIVCHDEDLDRLCGDKRKVIDIAFDDLPDLKQKIPMHFSKLLGGEFQTYDRKPRDQKHFSSLEDVLKAFPRSLPMSIEVKDRGNDEAALGTIALARKYNRLDTTLIGSDEAWSTRQILALDPEIATFCATTDVIKIIFTYWLGLLPYLKLEREAALLPYMTRDFITMKETEREQATGCFKKAFFTMYISCMQLANMTLNPALLHL